MVKQRRLRALNSYTNRAKARREKKDLASQRKADYFASLPKNPVARTFSRMHPKRLWGFWLSRKGGLMILKIIGVSILLGLLLVGGLFAYYRKDLDQIRPEELAKKVHSTVTKYYDRRGPAGGADALLWEDKGDNDYTLVVDGNQISPLMKKATVAIEDKDFYSHGGVSLTGIARAFINNYSGGSTQGGSTLTQQLVKQVFFRDEAQKRGLAGIPRKIKEVILSIEVERMYNKDQILNLYLNKSPYGGRRNGVQSAAKTYFGTDAKNLSLAQSALLAAIPNQPSLYDPYNPDGQKALVQRQHKVLDEMVSQGFVKKSEANKAKAEPILDTVLPQASQFSDIKAAHFVQMVRSQLETQLGKAVVGQGGLVVTTTLDLRIQNQLEASFDEMFNPENPKYKGTPVYAGFENGAATVQDTKTGQIVALMGSRDYNYPGFGQNNAAVSYIQPGSTIKPLVFSNLFSKHEDLSMNIYGSGTVLPDVRTVFAGGYKPNDADGAFKGNIPIRQGLALSRNIPAVRAMSIAGVESTLQHIRNVGDISYCTQGNEVQVGLAAAIGGCGTKQVDHVNAFSTLAREGTYKPVTTVLEVRNSNSDVVLKWQDNQSKRVIDPQVAYILADILSDDNARAGLYGRNFPGLIVDRGRVKTASKTGTSDIDGKSRDIWMMSYSPALTMGVWLGNNDPKPLRNGNSSLPGTIINQVMTFAHQEVYAKEGKWKSGDWYSAPSGIIRLAGELYPSWYNKEKANQAEKVIFDKVSKKKVTSCTPEAAKIEQNVIKTVDPITKKPSLVASDGYDTNAEDDVHLCGDATPSIYSIAVIALGPNTYKITAGVNAGKGNLTGISFTVNNQTLESKAISSSGSYQTTYTSSGEPGTLNISITATDDLFYTGVGNKTYP